MIIKKLRQTKGFTLIELLVVVAIIGILAAVGVTAFSGFQESAKVKSMQSIHAGVVKVIASELKKCTLGQSTFMTGTKADGSNYASNCNNNSTTLASNAVAGIVILKDKDPWKTGDAAVQSGTGFTKGKTNVRNQGNIIEIRSCWGDGCAAADRRLSTVQAE